MSRILKVARRVALVAAAVVVALLTVAFAVNAFDERLTILAQVLLKAPTNPYPPDENAFLLLVGMDAPPGASVVATAEAKVARAKALHALGKTDPSAALAQIEAELRGPATGLKVAAPEHFCESRVEHVWDDFSGRRTEVLALVAQNRELLDRYARARRGRGFYDPGEVGVTGPLPFPPTGLRCLFLADIATRLAAQDRDERATAFGLLMDDIRLWRMAIEGEAGIGAKLVAANAWRGDIILLADALASTSQANIEPLTSKVADDALLDLDGTKFGAAFARDAREVLEIYSWPDPPSGEGNPTRAAASLLERIDYRLVRHFWKQNATVNLLAKQTAQATRLMARVPAGIVTEYDAYRRWCEQELGPAEPQVLFEPLAWARARAREAPLAVAYNPIGHSVVAWHAAADTKWVDAFADTVAIQRAVRLALEIRRARLPADAISAFLASHPNLSTHPIAATPFRFDSATAEISVPPAFTWPSWRRMSVRVWRDKPGS